MGRNKKTGGGKPTAVETAKVFCFFCDKEFDDDRVLINHQCMKHFRCTECRSGSSGKCNTLHGLIIHYRKVHNAELKVTPNSLPERAEPVPHMQIVGMRNVPEEVLEEWSLRSSGPLQTAAFHAGSLPMAMPEPEFVRLQLPGLLPGPLPGVPGPLAGAALGGMPGMQVPGGMPGSMAEMLGSLPQLQQLDAPKDEETDFASQVAQWMATRKPVEPEVEVAPPPPEPEEPRAPAAAASFAPAFQPAASSRMFEPSAPVQFFLPVPQPQQPAAPKKEVQATAASFLAEALGNLEASRLASVVAKSIPQAVKPQAATQQSSTLAVPAASAPSASSASAPAQRSRSRGRRSRSRGQPSSTQRAPAPSAGGNTYESRTLEIIGAHVTSRLWLKKEMERFGRVEVCHTGNRQNPEAEPPWVRFEKMIGVENALQCINAGQVLLDGAAVKARMKSDNRPKQAPREERRPQRSPRRGDLEVTSRDLARDDTRRSKEGPGNYSSRDLARDDIRSRMGPGNYSSRDLARTDAANRRRGRSSSSSSRPARKRR